MRTSFSQRTSNAVGSPLDRGSLEEALERVSKICRAASQRLFDLSYQIQVTGKLPDPVSLTETMVCYREARGLMEDLRLQVASACNGDIRVGTPVQPE
jgi:hypothetical protein